MEKEICWNITAKCNQNCRYCHRFLNIENLCYEDNKKILDNLIQLGITAITWTGGESLILSDIDDLLKFSFESGIKNKVITNGKVLTNERIDKIIPYIDTLTLSIDTIDDDKNNLLGRGKDHFQNIDRILNYIRNQNYSVNIKINTVIGKFNINDMANLINYLNEFDITSWRLFKFMPLREKAVKNKNEFCISSSTFNKEIDLIKEMSNIKNIEAREEADMEEKYILILADGNIVKTENGKDLFLGNALCDKIIL